MARPTEKIHKYYGTKFDVGSKCSNQMNLLYVQVLKLLNQNYTRNITKFPRRASPNTFFRAGRIVAKKVY